MPDYSYNFRGLTSVAELPGISNSIKTTLDMVIREALVWPHRLSYTFPLSEVCAKLSQHPRLLV